MVLLMTRPLVLDITAEDEDDIFDLLRASGGMNADEVAGALRMDEAEVAIYLANQAGLGKVSYQAGEYSVFHWL
jgi:hypothetical protein